MSIRWRLAVLGTVLATGTVVLFALLLFALATFSTPADQDRALDTLAEQAAREYRPGGGPPALTIDPATTLDPFVVVARADGSVAYSQALIRGEPPQLPPGLVEAALRDGSSRTTAELGGIELRMSARPLPTAAGSPDREVAIAAQPTAFARDQLAGLRVASIIAAVLTAVAGAVASWVVSGQALRPLRRLATTTGEIARTGDTSQRLPVPRRRDEVGELARQFNAMMDRLQAGLASLEESLEQQRRFVADASHELRTPLTTIRANAGFLDSRPDAAAGDRDAALDDLRAEADRMAGLVDDLMILARNEAAAAPPVRLPVDLTALVADVCRLTGARVGSPPVTELAAPADGPAVRAGSPVTEPAVQPVVVPGDEAQLRRMLRCLVDNGQSHGGGDVTVAVWRRAGPWVALSAGPWAALSVVDRGSGFPEAALPHVFERFYRADPARSGPGSGLGLALVASTALAHGGSVHAANHPGGGAVVTVQLPAL